MDQLDAEALYRAVREQLRATYGAALEPGGEVALVGIYSGGAWLAERFAADFGHAGHGAINVSLHRDDFAEKGLQAQASPTSLPFEVEGRRIVLVDDVLYTGRTIRAAVNEIYDYGRPAAIDLAVLVDRGGRELPIGARFTGASIELPRDRTLVLAQDPAGVMSFHTEARVA